MNLNKKIRITGYFFLVVSLAIMVFTHILPVYSPEIDSYMSGRSECGSPLGCGAFLLYFLIELISFFLAMVFLIVAYATKPSVENKSTSY